MPKWNQTIKLRDLLDEDKPAVEVAKAFHERLKTITWCPEIKEDIEELDWPLMMEGLEELVQDSRLTTEEFDYWLDGLYDLCDAYRIWIEL